MYAGIIQTDLMLKNQLQKKDLLHWSCLLKEPTPITQ